jgi:hypothetical protein
LSRSSQKGRSQRCQFVRAMEWSFIPCPRTIGSLRTEILPPSAVASLISDECTTPPGPLAPLRFWSSPVWCKTRTSLPVPRCMRQRRGCTSLISFAPLLPNPAATPTLELVHPSNNLPPHHSVATLGRFCADEQGPYRALRARCNATCDVCNLGFENNVCEDHGIADDDESWSRRVALMSCRTLLSFLDNRFGARAFFNVCCVEREIRPTQSTCSEQPVHVHIQTSTMFMSFGCPCGSNSSQEIFR